jgi:hypothetical protein
MSIGASIAIVVGRLQTATASRSLSLAAAKMMLPPNAAERSIGDFPDLDRDVQEADPVRRGRSDARCAVARLA